MNLRPPLVPNGVAVLRSLLAHLLANYSVRGRMRLYGATNSCPKVLDFPHYKVRGRTRTNAAIRSFEPVGNGQIIWRHFDEHFVAGELATILLPNSSARSRTSQHQARADARKSQTDSDVTTWDRRRSDSRRRISSAVHSTTLPPLREAQKVQVVPPYLTAAAQ